MAKWTAGKYSTWIADLGSGFGLIVYWDSIKKEAGKPYGASVMGRDLTRRFATVEEAQAAAERAARQVFTHALAVLDEREG